MEICETVQARERTALATVTLACEVTRERLDLMMPEEALATVIKSNSNQKRMARAEIVRLQGLIKENAKKAKKAKKGTEQIGSPVAGSGHGGFSDCQCALPRIFVRKSQREFGKLWTRAMSPGTLRCSWDIAHVSEVPKFWLRASHDMCGEDHSQLLRCTGVIVG
jgi:hypothetical protein